MRDTAISTFQLGELEAGMAVEVVLMTPASMRLVPDGEGAVYLSMDDDGGNSPRLQTIRHLKVPHSGGWRLLVEHADSARRGGCAIRIFRPEPRHTLPTVESLSA